jgi:hypothetical protein
MTINSFRTYELCKKHIKEYIFFRIMADNYLNSTFNIILRLDFINCIHNLYKV